MAPQPELATWRTRRLYSDGTRDLARVHRHDTASGETICVWHGNEHMLERASIPISVAGVGSIKGGPSSSISYNRVDRAVRAPHIRTP
jgi:hypothetical protein